MFRLVRKLKTLKKVIREFNNQNYSDIEKRVMEASEALASAQIRTLNDPSIANAQSEIALQEKWQTLSNAEESFFHQRSRVTWISVGDRNTPYFHRMANARQSINHIHYLIDEDGVRHESQDEIQNLCVSYFTNLLGKPVEPALFIQEDITSLLNFSCSPSQQAGLISPFTSEDIRSAFFSLPLNKASGQDGYTPDFFMSYWYVVGGEVTAAVAEFFNSGHLLKQMNATNLALIPKIPNASKNSDFRPISCLNTTYKVISKLLYDRLKGILNSVIGQSQSSFLPGRLLSGNIILATKIVHGYNTNNVDPSGMLKVDLRKAFDTLRWDFVIADLRGINIPELYMAGSTNVSALRHSLSLSTATPGASSRVHRDFVRATHSLHTYLCSPWRFSPAFCDLDTILGI